jgi:uncharacterized membrane protein YkoI
MITGSEAIEIARARAGEKGWAFVDPVDLVERRSWAGAVTRYEIATNDGKLGAKARFVVDAATGQVLSDGYVKR